MPNLHALNKNKIDLPPDIIKRNELLLSLRSETSLRGFQNNPEEPKDSSLKIYERSNIWLKNKLEKQEACKKNNENKLTIGCTIVPELISRRYQSTNTTQRNLSAETSYSELYLRKKCYHSSLSSRNKKKSDKTTSQDTKESILKNTAKKTKYVDIHLNKRIFYQQLFPVSMSVSNLNGYSHDLLTKAKPMINYTDLRLLSK